MPLTVAEWSQIESLKGLHAPSQGRGHLQDRVECRESAGHSICLIGGARDGCRKQCRPLIQDNEDTCPPVGLFSIGIKTTSIEEVLPQQVRNHERRSRRPPSRPTTRSTSWQRVHATL